MTPLSALPSVLPALALALTQIAPAVSTASAAQAAPGAPGAPGSPGSTSGGTGHHQVSTAPGELAHGLHQTAYSSRRGALFATTATGVSESTIYRLDADTLGVQHSATLPADPSATAGPDDVLAAYGVGVDDQQDTVWVTHSRQNTVSVLDQSTLTPLRSHPAGSVPGARDVVHDPGTGRVFVSSASPSTEGEGSISVFEGDDEDGDGERFEKIGETGVLPRDRFSPMSLALDPLTGTVWTVSLSTPRAMAIDTSSLDFEVVDLELPDTGAAGPSGLAVDPVARRLYIASQDDDLLLVTNFSGRRIAATPTGDGPLSVAFEPVRRRVYVTNFAANSTPHTSVSVLDARGRLLEQLPFERAHHVTADRRGSIHLSTLSSAAEATGKPNQVIRLTPRRTAHG